MVETVKVLDSEALTHRSLEELMRLAAVKAQEELTADGIVGLCFLMQCADGSVLMGSFNRVRMGVAGGEARCLKILKRLHLKCGVRRSVYFYDARDTWIGGNQDRMLMWGVEQDRAITQEYSMRSLRVDVNRQAKSTSDGNGRWIDIVQQAMREAREAESQAHKQAAVA